MSARDSALFEQPLNFVHQIDEGKHIVLFYEELEYAKMLSFQFIKTGLALKKDCSYLSEEDEEAVKREMTDAGLGVNKYIQAQQLHIYQVPSLTDYHHKPDYSHIEGKDKASQQPIDMILNDSPRIRQSDRIVLRCVYKITGEQQIKSNLRWEYGFRCKNLKNIGTTLVSSYPINDIISTISDSTGSYGKWMSTLLELYDGVIFARKFWKGVAFNLA
ncbi:MAG TPA: hypothetical protein VE593_00355 [Nitrososphaeraceae archaeon]|nr:hypothetical protein [Nitrososphaeraceae archaeon]